MSRMFLVAISVLFFSLSTMSQSAEAQFLWGQNWGWSSINCTSIIAGVSKKSLADVNVSCIVNIKEVIASCKNKKGNADPANGQPFRLLEGVDLQGQSTKVNIKLSKQGKGIANTVFDNATIEAALGAVLDPVALGCPNRNWQVQFVVSAMDGLVELLEGADGFDIRDGVTENNGECMVGVEFDPEFACDVIDADASCTQVDCMYFHHPFDPDDNTVREVLDTTPCEKLNRDFTTPDGFDCLCDLQVEDQGTPSFACNNRAEKEG